MAQVLTPEKYVGVNYGTYTDSRFLPSVFVIGNAIGPVVSLGDSIKTLNRNKDWRQQVARRQDASLDYLRSGFLYRPAHFHASSSYQFKDGATPVIISSSYTARNVFGHSLISTADDTALRDLALARLKNRLNGNIGNFNALVPLVELREMRGLVRATAKLTTGLVKTLLTIKKTKGKSAAKYASEAWLNFSFGVRPLVSDTQKASEAIAAYLQRVDHQNVSIHGSSSKTWRAGSKNSGVNGPYGVVCAEQFDGLHTLSYRYVGGVNLALASSNNYGLQETFGLTMSNLPSLLWELTAFSWIADYFTTMGAYLEDTFQLPPGSLIYLNLCKRYTFEGQSTYKVRSVNTGVLLGHHVEHSGFIRYNYFQRTKLASIPHRALRFKTADEIGINAVNRLLNLTALLVPNALKRGR